MGLPKGQICVLFYIFAFHFSAFASCPASDTLTYVYDDNSGTCSNGTDQDTLRLGPGGVAIVAVSNGSAWNCSRISNDGKNTFFIPGGGANDSTKAGTDFVQYCKVDDSNLSGSALGVYKNYQLLCTKGVTCDLCAQDAKGNELLLNMSFSQTAMDSAYNNSGLNYFCVNGSHSLSKPVIDPADSSRWKWTCSTGAKGTGLTTTCNAKLGPSPISGACGTADRANSGILFSVPSGGQLCKYTSAPASVSGPDIYGNVSWTCFASGGATNASCGNAIQTCANDAAATWDAGGNTCSGPVLAASSPIIPGILGISTASSANTGTASCSCGTNGTWSCSGTCASPSYGLCTCSDDFTLLNNTVTPSSAGFKLPPYYTNCPKSPDPLALKCKPTCAINAYTAVGQHIMSNAGSPATSSLGNGLVAAGCQFGFSLNNFTERACGNQKSIQTCYTWSCTSPDQKVTVSCDGKY